MNYYLLLTVLIIISAIMMKGWREGNKAYVIVASLLMFGIFGLRNTFVIGGDTTSSYLHSFQEMPNRSWSSLLTGGGSNQAFYALCKLFYELSNGDYQLFVSTTAIFVTICLGLLIYRYSPNPVQSILYHFGLLLFTFHFSALKQSIAMAILMLAFHNLIRKKTIRYLLLVLIAGQIHFPANIFLLAWPMSKLRIGRNYLFFLAGLLLVTYLLRTQLVSLMLSTYRDLEDSTNIANLSGVTFFRTKSLIMLLIVIAAIVFRKPTPSDPIYCLLLEFMGIAVVFQTFCGYNNIFERLADYFFQFSIVFIPMIFDRTADREPLLGWRLTSLIDQAAPFLFSGYAVYRFITYTQNSPYLYPFRFFFES